MAHDTHPDVLKLAREIANQTVPEDSKSANYKREWYVARDAAIAAIEKTTTEAAVWLTQQAAIAEMKCVSAEHSDGRRNYAAGAVTARRAASAIASFDHLRQSEKDNSDAG